MSKEKQGGKNRKYGRNKPWCLQYVTRRTEKKNKERRLVRHMKKFPNDLQSAEVLQKI